MFDVVATVLRTESESENFQTVKEILKNFENGNWNSQNSREEESLQRFMKKQENENYPYSIIRNRRTFLEIG